MKTTLFALTALSLTLSAHAAAPNAEKVAAALNASLGESLVQVENGRLKLPRSQHNNKDAGFEDCRQLAINSALLDIAMGGETPELVAKGSHRILLSMATDENSVRGIVGVKVTQDNGGIAERAYSYLLQDSDNKHCDLIANEGYVAGHTKRSKLEKDYLKNVIPKLSADDKAKMLKHAEVTTDAELAAENVKKLLKGECSETSLNQALAGSAKAFAAKSKEKSVAYLVLGLGESSLITEGTNAKGSIKVVRTDGATTLKTLTTLAMLEGDKTCTLTSVSTAEVK